MYSTSARALAPILAKQQNVIELRQVVHAGRDPELPAREVAAGRWRLLARRIYLAEDSDPTLLQRAWCAQLIGGPDTVVSGPLACRVLGLPDVPGLRAVCLVGAGCRRRGDVDYVVRRTSRAGAGQERDGLRIASARRAVIDTSRLATGLRDVRALVCGALSAKRVSYDELLAELNAEPRAGLALLRRALQDWGDGARSAPEAEMADELRALVWAGKLPPFLLNPSVYDGAVLLGAPDVYVPGRAVGAEADSARHHGAIDHLDATLTRHATFARYGIRLEHVTPRRFRRTPTSWAAQFAAITEERRGVGDPPGLRIEPVGPLQPVPGRRRPR